MAHYPGFDIEDLLECGHARVARVVPVQMLLLEVPRVNQDENSASIRMRMQTQRRR